MPATATSTRYHLSPTTGKYSPCSAQSDDACPFTAKGMPGLAAHLGHVNGDTAEIFNKRIEELRVFEAEMLGTGKARAFSAPAARKATLAEDPYPYDSETYLPVGAVLASRVAETRAQVRNAVKNIGGERGGAIREVVVQMKPERGRLKLDEPKTEVQGPKDGRPIVVDFNRASYTDIDVVGGTAIVNAHNTYGGAVRVKNDAAATVITPPGKFHVYAEDNSDVIVVPRAGARGSVYVGKNATARISNPGKVEHSIEIRHLDRDRV